MLDYGAIATALLETALASASPEQGWIALLDEVERHGAVPPELRDRDVATETAQLRGEVAGVLAREPVPPGTGFIYFGLFEAWEEETDEPVAGFYIAGGAGDAETEEVTAERLAYLPESRWFTLALLDAIQAAPARGEYDRTLMQYALMLGAAVLLVRHATARLLDGCTLVVGFDEGDRVVVRGPSIGEG